MRELWKRGPNNEIRQDHACTVLSDARLSGARTAFAKVMTKEYGDAGGLDDLLLVLPEL